MTTSGFVDPENHLYTNLAFRFSDQYDIPTKMAVYQGLNRSVFRSKKEFQGSIVKHIERVMEYYEVCNEVRVIIDGKPTRTEIPSYDMSSAREAILNCYCHRDFSRKLNIKIEFFDDRCEIISPSVFFDGLTLEDALNGLQSFINENLVKLLYKLEYVENYASGLTRIFQNSKELGIVPEIYTSLYMFKVTLPNKNYEGLYLNPEKHIEDNKVKSNGRVNSDINEEHFQLENQKDIEILEIIRDNPGIRLKEIAPKLKSKYPSINSNIIYKRIKILDSYIEFRGIPKKGG